MPFEMDSTISIHAPREGGDGRIVLCGRLTPQFQSPPPAWGATSRQTPAMGTAT